MLGIACKQSLLSLNRNSQNSELNCNLILLRKKKLGGTSEKFKKTCFFIRFALILPASEGRNPWVKNAFLAFTHITKSPISKRGVETMQRSFCLYIPHKYSLCCTPQGIYDSVGYLFLSSFSLWRLAMPVI